MATVTPEAAPRLSSRNPATGAELGSVAVTPPNQVAEVVTAIAKVQPLWALLRVADRARYMRRMAQAVIDDFDELADLLVAEQGRPRAEVAALELLAAIDALSWVAAEGASVLGGRRAGPCGPSRGPRRDHPRRPGTGRRARPLGCRQDPLHGPAGDRPGGRASLRLAREGGDGGDRRQGRDVGARRRQRAARGGGRPVGGLRRRGPGARAGRARVRRPGGLRAGPRPARARRSGGALRRPCRRGHPAGPPFLRPPP